MNTLKRSKVLFDYLLKAGPSTVKAVLKTLSPEEIQLFGEISSNLLRGALKISAQHKTLLSKYAEIIRKLARREIRPVTRQRLLVKHSDIVVKLIKIVHNKLFPKNGSN